MPNPNSASRLTVRGLHWWASRRQCEDSTGTLSRSRDSGAAPGAEPGRFRHIRDGRASSRSRWSVLAASRARSGSDGRCGIASRLGRSVPSSAARIPAGLCRMDHRHAPDSRFAPGSTARYFRPSGLIAATRRRAIDVGQSASSGQRGRSASRGAATDSRRHYRLHRCRGGHQAVADAPRPGGAAQRFVGDRAAIAASR